MKLQQLSIFLENKPGQLLTPCKALGDAGINIVTLSLADTEQFGILRVIVKDSQRGKAVLESAGCVVNITEVVAVAAPYRPGGLADVLRVIEQAGISIEYMYACPGRQQADGVLIFRFEDADTATNVLRSRGVRLVSSDELSRLLDAK